MFLVSLVLIGSIIVLWQVMSRAGSSNKVVFEKPIPGLGNSVEMELIELEPPIDTWKDEFLAPATKETIPWWVMSNYWTLRLKESDLKKFFTEKGMQDARKLGEIPLGLEPPEIFARTTHAVRLKVGEFNYFFTGIGFADKRENLPNWGRLIGTRSNVEGSWKIDAAPEWAKYFDFGNEEAIRGMLRTKKARLNELNVLVPVEASEA